MEVTSSAFVAVNSSSVILAVSESTSTWNLADSSSGNDVENDTLCQRLTTVTLVPLPALARRDEGLVKVEVAVQAVIFVLAVGGNAIVLGMLLSMSRRKDLSRMYTMIGHLSCADLFVAVFNLLPQLLWDLTYRFHGGRFMCKTIKYAQLVVLYASSYVLVSTAVDRYTAICHPMLSHTWTSSAAHRLVAVAWAASLLLAVPQLIIFDYVELEPPGSGVYDCWEHFEPPWTLSLYVTWFTAAVYLLPLVFLAAIYARICSVVWNSAAGIPRGAVSLPPWSPPRGSSDASSSKPPPARSGVIRTAIHRAEPTDRDGLRQPSVTTDAARGCDGAPFDPTSAGLCLSRAKTKTVKLTLTVVASYAICWGPFFFAQMWSAWDPDAPFEGKAMVITLLLASLNSCTNPWIYMAFSDHLRRRLRRCCSRVTLKRSATHTTTTMLSYSTSTVDFRSGTRNTRC